MPFSVQTVGCGTPIHPCMNNVASTFGNIRVRPHRYLSMSCWLGKPRPQVRERQDCKVAWPDVLAYTCLHPDEYWDSNFWMG